MPESNNMAPGSLMIGMAWRNLRNCVGSCASCNCRWADSHATVRVTNASLRAREAGDTLHWRNGHGSIYLPWMADKEVRMARKLENKPKLQVKKQLMNQNRETCGTQKMTGPKGGPSRSCTLWDDIKVTKSVLPLVRLKDD